MTKDFAFDPKVISKAEKYLEDVTGQYLDKKQLNVTSLTLVSVHVRRTGTNRSIVGFKMGHS